MILGEVTGVDKERKLVMVSNADREAVQFAYDHLILASGATHSYFGHDEFEQLAQVAKQQRRYAAKVIHNRLTTQPPPKPFSYFDKGNMAVVGKGFAVLDSGKGKVSSLGAWLTWAVVHLQFLATSSLRLAVFPQWIWTT